MESIDIVGCAKNSGVRWAVWCWQICEVLSFNIHWKDYRQVKPFFSSTTMRIQCHILDFSYHVAKNIRELIFNVSKDILIINSFTKQPEVYISILEKFGIISYQVLQQFFFMKTKKYDLNKHWEKMGFIFFCTSPCIGFILLSSSPKHYFELPSTSPMHLIHTPSVPECKRYSFLHEY